MIADRAFCQSALQLRWFRFAKTLAVGFVLPISHDERRPVAKSQKKISPRFGVGPGDRPHSSFFTSLSSRGMARRASDRPEPGAICPWRVFPEAARGSEPLPVPALKTPHENAPRQWIGMAKLIGRRYFTVKNNFTHGEYGENEDLSTAARPKETRRRNGWPLPTSAFRGKADSFCLSQALLTQSRCKEIER
jgi:hypothetical protein